MVNIVHVILGVVGDPVLKHWVVAALVRLVKVVSCLVAGFLDLGQEPRPRHLGAVCVHWVEG